MSASSPSLSFRLSQLLTVNLGCVELGAEHGRPPQLATMKMKHKGKIYPSPSTSSSGPSTSQCNRDVLSVMKLLPAAILALVSVLSLEDREVLAYMITRSLDSSNLSSFNFERSKGSKRSSKKQPGGGGGGGGSHKPPVFGCDCFGCYTSYWLRWDSSPNRELIHQVIEAFEEHLATGEATTKRTARGKRREKPGRRGAARPEPAPPTPAPTQSDYVVPDHGGLRGAEAVNTAAEEPRDASPTGNEAVPVTSPEAEEEAIEAAAGKEEAVDCGGAPGLTVVAAGSGSHHKGLARKVLPDVLGLLNSRLWKLWSPNV